MCGWDSPFTRSLDTVTAWLDQRCPALRHPSNSTRFLPRIAKSASTQLMPTMKISLPESRRSFVEEQIAQGRYATTSDYIRDLIRRDQDRRHLRDLLLAGATSKPGPVADDCYFDDLRDTLDATSGA